MCLWMWHVTEWEVFFLWHLAYIGITSIRNGHRKKISFSVIFGLHRNNIHKEVSQGYFFCSVTLLVHRHFLYVITLALIHTYMTVIECVPFTVWRLTRECLWHISLGPKVNKLLLKTNAWWRNSKLETAITFKTVHSILYTKHSDSFDCG